MFYGCETIKEINMIEQDTSKIKKFGESSNGLQGLFYGCKKLENIKMNINFELYFGNGTFYSGLPQDGTFTYKVGKNMSSGSLNCLLRNLPKNWKKIKEE